MIFYLPILKVSCANLSGWKVWILKTPHFGAPNFVQFYLSLIFACVSWNCDVSSLHNSKVEIFCVLVWEGPPIVVPQKVCQNLSFLHIYQFWKLHQSSVSSSSLNFRVFVWGTSLHFGIPKFCQMLSFLHICLSWKVHVSSMSDWLIAWLVHLYPPITRKRRCAIFWTNPHPLRSWPFSKLSCWRFDFFPRKFAACSKPPSRDNHRKASHPRTQQRDQGAGWTHDPAIRVVVKTTPLPIRPRCRQSLNFG